MSPSGGTTTVECKSGYGLSTAEELRALRIIGRVAERLPIRVVRTLLAAHALPPEAASPAAYVELVVSEIIPAAAAEGLAEFCDVFCDEGFFSVAMSACSIWAYASSVAANELRYSSSVIFAFRHSPSNR